MQGALDTFLAGQVLAFLLAFSRLGSAFMVMPGTGDAYVSPNVRLGFALSMSFLMYPMILKYIPDGVPSLLTLSGLVVFEVVIGIFIGSIARIFMMALDTGGMIISMQSGLANAQVLNPALATQGSLVGAFLTTAGVVLLFATNMHHIMISGLMESYILFPIGAMPDEGSMAEVISKAVAHSFMIGVKISMPFIVVTLLIYAAMGVMTRLMPQVQIFLVMIPLQMMLSFILLVIVMSGLLYYWITNFETAIYFFFSNGTALQ